MDKYINWLKDYDMKTTTQRLSILKSLDDRKHATIEEIHSDLVEHNPTMSLTTIYRNIGEMMKNLLVSEVKLPKRKNIYEVSKDSHIHLLCETCGKIEDAYIDMTDTLQKIKNRYFCDILDNDVTLSITCKECKEKMGNL